MRNYKKAGLAVMGLSAALLAGNTLAATPITFTGTNVSYTLDAEALGLFGPLGSVSISGDTLSFAPSDFNISGSGLIVDTLLVSVSAHSGYLFSSFSLTEGGSYTGGGTVDVGGMLEVRDNYTTNSNFVEAGIVETLGAGNWTAGTGNVLPLAGWGENGVFNSATLTITNLLTVTDATLRKDFVSISAIATPVPEAQTYAMMLAGLGLVGFMARRRRLATA